MKIKLYLVCYNEAIMLPRTVDHYRRKLGANNVNIVILDNYSTDNSVDVALSLNTNVQSWGDRDQVDDFKLRDLKNDVWRHPDIVAAYDWVIVCDMDEWLCCTYMDLLNEQERNATLIKTCGYEMVAKSTTLDLKDVDLYNLNTGVYSKHMSKCICFSPKHITNINYGIGAHVCEPQGEIKWSHYQYKLKHMNFLGKNYIVCRNRRRYQRSKRMREQFQLATHYLGRDSEIINLYKSYLRWSSNII